MVSVAAADLDQATTDATLAPTVRKANILARARYVLSTRAQMLVFYAITLIDPEDPNLAREYTVEAKAFAEWADLNLPALRRDLRKLSLEARDRTLVIRHFHPKRKVWGTLDCSWFAEAFTLNQKGNNEFVDIRFTPSLVPYLVGLREHYYQARRVFFIKLISRYAVRLYEWIESERYRLAAREGRLVVELDELRGILGTDNPLSKVPAEGGRTAPDSQLEDGKDGQFVRDGVLYERKLGSFHHFRENALEIAVKEVNQRTDLFVKYNAIRGGSLGRGVHTIAFEVAPRAGGGTEADAKPGNAEPEDQQLMLAYPPAPTPAEAPTTPPGRADAGPEGNPPDGGLGSLLGTLAAKYRLSRQQREGIPAIAREHGYRTEQQIVDWLLELDKGVVRNGRSENASRDFVAAVKNNYAPGVPAYKLSPTRHPSKSKPAAPEPAPPAEAGPAPTPAPADPDAEEVNFEDLKQKVRDSIEQADRLHAQRQAEHRANRRMGRTPPRAGP